MTKKKSDHRLLYNPGDYVPEGGHADWDPEEYEPDVEEFLHNEDFDHELGDQAIHGVDDAVRDLTDQEVQAFLDYVEPSVHRDYQRQAEDPYEDFDHPGEGPEYGQLIDARKKVADDSAGLSPAEQQLISQRMSLAMGAFGYKGEGPFKVPLDILDAIMYGTDFSDKTSNVSVPIPIDLPEKSKKALEKAINYLLSISDATFWKNMAIATKKIGLTPLDGCIFMNMTIGMFGLKQPFVWDSEMDRFQYINTLKEAIKNSKQGDKLYNFFTTIISFKYKNKPIPRSVSATLARDAFCLLYIEVIKS